MKVGQAHERGELRLFIRASWTSDAEVNLWDSLVPYRTQTLDEEVASQCLEVGPLLGTDTDTRIVVIHVHKSDDDKKEENCSLFIGPSPDGDVPLDVKIGNDKIGGHEGLWRILNNRWQSTGSPTTATYVINFNVNGNKWSCAALPKTSATEPRILKLAGDGDALVEQIGYRFPSRGPVGIEEVAVIYRHQRDDFAVTVMGQGPISYRAGKWLPYADTLCDTVIGALFNQREDGK